MSEEEIVADGKELHHCPDCGEEVEVIENIKSQGEGVAFEYIECIAQCGFGGERRVGNRQNHPSLT